MIDKTELKRQLISGMNCAQCVFGAFAERFDYAPEEFQRIAAGFGGGMFRGDTCGAVTGGIMALGAAFGDDDEVMHEMVKQFRDEFTARFGTTVCRELLGYDFSKPGEHDKAMESGVIEANCPGFVTAAAEIVEKLLDK